MDDNRISLITQSVIAVIVVLGGGAFIFLKPDDSQVVIGIVGTVIGWYFRGAAANQSATLVSDIHAQAAQVANKAANSARGT